MIKHPDLTPLHNAADYAATLAFAHIPADRLLAVVPPIRLELIALRLGARADALELLRLVDALLADETASAEARAAFQRLRRESTALAVWVTP